MKPTPLSILCIIVFTLTVFTQPARQGRARTGARRQTAPAAQRREAAYRANNLGVALLEQFNYGAAAAEFKRALALEPRLALGRINLAIALYNIPDLAGAERAARAALEVAPRAPQPHYTLGLIYKQQNRAAEAAEAFRRVLDIDPDDTGANVQLGQLLAQRRDLTQAIALFRRAVSAEPYNGTALYNLSTALLRAGEREEGGRLLQRFQELRQSGAATIIGQNYLEQGRYAEAVVSTGAEADLVDRQTPAVVFTDATLRALPAFRGELPRAGFFFGQQVGGATLFDYDADGDLDLIEVAGRSLRLLRNDAGKFTDVTAQAGALAKPPAVLTTGVVAGDCDNDGRPDLFVLGDGASFLYRNDGGGRFSDVTAAAKLPAYKYRASSAALVDYDHDGDLDIFIAGGLDISKSTKDEMEATGKRATGQVASFPAIPDSFELKRPPAPSLLLRNNGDGTFTDQTAAAKLSAPLNAFAVVPTDYDNRRDVDLLIAEDDALALWRNLRDGSFRDVAAEVGLGGVKQPLTSVAAGDVNKDGFTDFYLGGGREPGRFALSDGKGRFQVRAGPSAREGAPSENDNGAFNQASQLLDYDNDGLLDLVSVVTTGAASAARIELRVWRNTGDGWKEVSEKARGVTVSIKPNIAERRVLLSGDLDGDGDTDIIYGAPGGGLKFARNDGGNRHASARVRLAGKVSNRSGAGVKIEARAGSLWQRIETYAATPAPAPADVLFGLGGRASADAVRVLWPSGVVQAETRAARAARGAKGGGGAELFSVEELDRKPSSCPYLYTWNGKRFEFVTDFMGGGELGYWEAPGVRSSPDPDEYVRIRGDQLKAKDGRYELRVTNELEEGLFVDRLRLVAVAHPQGVEVYPNEGLGNPTSSVFKLYTTRGARPPRKATDEHGHDVLPRVARLDRMSPDDFKLHATRGYADEHTLTLDLGGEAAANGRTLLLLTGWTDYAFSSDNVAASQSGRALQPPALQVRDAGGAWRTVIPDIGIPVGRPQTVVVDLTGKFLSASREARIVTNMRIYWDQILVDTSGEESAVKVERLDPIAAQLRWRGFSAETTPDGREPYLYDYDRVSLTSPWKALPGRYTREGDVRELLLAVDDMFVISRPGDEISISFDAAALAPLPVGWSRTFLLYADGFSKEMDINSASPDQLAPLPFHGMKSYPYAAPDAYPATQAHAAYLERFNTRVVAAPVERLAGPWPLKRGIETTLRR